MAVGSLEPGDESVGFPMPSVRGVSRKWVWQVIYQAVLGLTAQVRALPLHNTVFLGSTTLTSCVSLLDLAWPVHRQLQR